MAKTSFKAIPQNPFTAHPGGIAAEHHDLKKRSPSDGAIVRGDTIRPGTWLAKAFVAAGEHHVGARLSTREGGVASTAALALQLLFPMSSESMGDHDSGPDDWWRPS